MTSQTDKQIEAERQEWLADIRRQSAAAVRDELERTGRAPMKPWNSETANWQPVSGETVLTYQARKVRIGFKSTSAKRK